MTEDPGAIGQQLRSARERMGLGISQAAAQLRVDEGVIDALETGRFHAIGAAVFVRGHLRHYAELVGEPSAPGRCASLDLAPPDLTAVPHLPSQAAVARRRWPLIVFAVVLLLAVTVWWALGVSSR